MKKYMTTITTEDGERIKFVSPVDKSEMEYIGHASPDKKVKVTYVTDGDLITVSPMTLLPDEDPKENQDA